MPHTLAHPAAVLPLLGRVPLPSSALVVGSVAPDLAYFVPLGVTRAESHALVGVLAFCLPAGLLAFASFHLLVAPLVADVAPDALRARLPARWERGAPPRARLALVLLAILLGALTHVGWDAFTHAGDPGVRAWPWLAEPLFTLRGFAVRPFKLLQHGGSLAGVAMIGVALVRWWRRAASRQAPPAGVDAPSLPAAGRLGRMSRLALVALVLLPSAALVTRASWTASTERAGLVRGLDHVLTVASFDGGTAFLAALLTVGLARRVTRGPRVEAASCVFVSFVAVAGALSAQEPAVGAEQVVPAHRIVHVTLVERDHGAPVPGVRVFAVGGLDAEGRADTRRFWSEHVRSDARGVARFEFLRPTTLEAIVVDRGTDTAPTWLPLEHPLDLDAPREFPADYELELGPGATVWGRVLDLDDRPVPGAVVHVATDLPYDLHGPGPGSWPVDPSRTPSVATDEEGRFELRGLGKHTHLLAAAPGQLALEALNGVLPEGSEVDDVLLRMAPAAELRGTLRTPDGAPADERLVMLLPLETPSYGAVVPGSDERTGYLLANGAGYTAMTDERGEFVLRAPAAPLHLGAAELMMPVSVSRTPDVEPGVLFVDVPPGEEPIELYVPERVLPRRGR